MGRSNIKTGRNGSKAGQQKMGQSRARTPLRGMSHLSHGTQMHGTRDTVVVGQDRASTPLRTPSHPTATTEQRFAGWIAGASKEQAERFARDMAGRGPELRTAEQQELFRLCGERILENHRNGRKVPPEALVDGKAWATLPKLPHALSSGEPVPDDQLPPALRGGALEVF